MSPPIRDGSGSSIGAIRLGDGSEISEVRTGAGDVLFSAAIPIPDSAIAQYDFRLEDGTTPVTDQIGNNNLSNGSYSGVGVTINGNQAGDFSGSEQVDGLFESTSERIVVYTVLRFDSVGGIPVDNNQGGDSSIDIVGTTSDWFINQGSSVISSTTPSSGTNFIVTTVFDSTDEMFVNGSSVVSGNAGSNTLDELRFGDGFDGRIGLVEIHNGSVSNGLATREQEIADDWGITI